MGKLAKDLGYLSNYKLGQKTEEISKMLDSYIRAINNSANA